MNNNYKSQLKCINNAKECIKTIEGEISKYEYKLYGSKDSPFYGLKYPTLFKICEYLCDQYKIPYDLMMDKIYHMIMKQQYEDSFRFIDYNKRLLYDSWDTHIEFYRNENDNEHRYFYGLKKSNRKHYLKNKNDLYLGSIPYRTRETRLHNTNIWGFISDATYKSKKQISDEGSTNTYYVNTITKQKIIEELNKLGIQYRLNMKKEELMKLLVKNK